MQLKTNDTMHFGQYTGLMREIVIGKLLYDKHKRKITNDTEFVKKLKQSNIDINEMSARLEHAEKDPNYILYQNILTSQKNHASSIKNASLSEKQRRIWNQYSSNRHNAQTVAFVSQYGAEGARQLLRNKPELFSGASKGKILDFIVMSPDSQNNFITKVQENQSSLKSELQNIQKTMQSIMTEEPQIIEIQYIDDKNNTQSIEIKASENGNINFVTQAGNKTPIKRIISSTLTDKVSNGTYKDHTRIAINSKNNDVKLYTQINGKPITLDNENLPRQDQIEHIDQINETNKNILISSDTGTGKTTLTSFLKNTIFVGSPNIAKPLLDHFQRKLLSPIFYTENTIGRQKKQNNFFKIQSELFFALTDIFDLAEHLSKKYKITIPNLSQNLNNIQKTINLLKDNNQCNPSSLLKIITSINEDIRNIKYKFTECKIPLQSDVYFDKSGIISPIDLQILYKAFDTISLQLPLISQCSDTIYDAIEASKVSINPIIISDDIIKDPKILNEVKKQNATVLLDEAHKQEAVVDLLLAQNIRTIATTATPTDKLTRLFKNRNAATHQDLVDNRQWVNASIKKDISVQNECEYVVKKYLHPEKIFGSSTNPNKKAESNVIEMFNQYIKTNNNGAKEVLTLEQLKTADQQLVSTSLDWILANPDNTLQRKLTRYLKKIDKRCYTIFQKKGCNRIAQMYTIHKKKQELEEAAKSFTELIQNNKTSIQQCISERNDIQDTISKLSIQINDPDIADNYLAIQDLLKQKAVLEKEEATYNDQIIDIIQDIFNSSKIKGSEPMRLKDAFLEALGEYSIDSVNSLESIMRSARENCIESIDPYRQSKGTPPEHVDLILSHLTQTKHARIQGNRYDLHLSKVDVDFIIDNLTEIQNSIRGKQHSYRMQKSKSINIPEILAKIEARGLTNFILNVEPNQLSKDNIHYISEILNRDTQNLGVSLGVMGNVNIDNIKETYSKFITPDFQTLYANDIYKCFETLRKGLQERKHTIENKMQNDARNTILEQKRYTIKVLKLIDVIKPKSRPRQFINILNLLKNHLNTDRNSNIDASIEVLKKALSTKKRTPKRTDIIKSRKLRNILTKQLKMIAKNTRENWKKSIKQVVAQQKQDTENRIAAITTAENDIMRDMEGIIDMTIRNKDTNIIETIQTLKNDIGDSINQEYWEKLVTQLKDLQVKRLAYDPIEHNGMKKYLENIKQINNIQKNENLTLKNIIPNILPNLFDYDKNGINDSDASAELLNKINHIEAQCSDDDAAYMINYTSQINKYLNRERRNFFINKIKQDTQLTTEQQDEKIRYISRLFLKQKHPIEACKIIYPKSEVKQNKIFDEFINFNNNLNNTIQKESTITLENWAKIKESRYSEIQEPVSQHIEIKEFSTDLSIRDCDLVVSNHELTGFDNPEISKLTLCVNFSEGDVKQTIGRAFRGTDVQKNIRVIQQEVNHPKNSLGDLYIKSFPHSNIRSP